MTDFFLQMGVSNACLSLALAIVAMTAANDDPSMSQRDND